MKTEIIALIGVAWLVGEAVAGTLSIPTNIPAVTDNSFFWRRPHGSYRWGMKGPGQWRVETRDTDGSVRGQYFYVTPEGSTVNMMFDEGGLRPLPGVIGMQDAALKSGHPFEKVSSSSISETRAGFRSADPGSVGDDVPYGALKLTFSPLLKSVQDLPRTTEDRQTNSIIANVE